MKVRDEARESVENVFLHTKPVKMLTVLKGDDVRYATQVSKSVDCTYSHTVKILEMFRKMGLVTFEKKGRVKIIKLTDHGKEVATNFEGVRMKFKSIAANLKEPLMDIKIKGGKAK